jgi:cathepsin C
MFLVLVSKKTILPSKSSAPSIRDVANRLHAGIQQSSDAGVKVRWKADPNKLAAWVRERNEVHGIDISEHSDVMKLLDVVSPPLAVGVPGFSTEQVIGPARQAAIRDQEKIARSLNKPMTELTMDDVKTQWTMSNTNHHEKYSFALGGRPLAADGWRQLKNFDWRKVSMQFGNSTISNFVPEVPDQGPCGSCYAFAATSMYSARLMLGYPHLHSTFGAHRGADRVSAQQQVYCNSYNQGCDGGYPFLISKWSSENTLYTEECVRQNAFSGRECPSAAQGPACRQRFRVKNWRYLGGALGRCGMHHLCEEAMREELYKGGPFPVSMDPPDEMIAYSGGVFHSYPGLEDHNLIKEYHTRNDTASCGDAECFVWRKVGHSVLVVGWGEDDSQGLTCQPRAHKTSETENFSEPGCERFRRQEDCQAVPSCIWRGFPYWVIQNSWGKKFGEDGYIRIGPRGSNPRWIESFPMAADMELLPPEHHHSRMTSWFTRRKNRRASENIASDAGSINS